MAEKNEVKDTTPPKKEQTRPGVQQCQAQGLVFVHDLVQFRTGLGYERLIGHWTTS